MGSIETRYRGPAAIGFICREPKHASGKTPYVLTIHDRRWAYCPHGSAARPHAWVAIGGATLSDLMATRRVSDLAR